MQTLGQRAAAAALEQVDFEKAAGLPRWLEGALFALGMGNMGHAVVKSEVPVISAAMQVLRKRPADLAQLHANAPIPLRPVKMADHAEDRALERTQIDPAYIRELRQFIHEQKDLPQIPLYHPLRGGFQGYATLTPVGRRHVVSTVLGPSMKPKGVPLSAVLPGVKVPEPALRKAEHA